MRLDSDYLSLRSLPVSSNPEAPPLSDILLPMSRSPSLSSPAHVISHKSVSNVNMSTFLKTHVCVCACVNVHPMCAVPAEVIRGR